ncbi:MAG: spermidine/putrescine ABC transporter substrate-binding protein [Acidimicrobiia bacterium]|nr:spermidine/putrescine ABC transporter substrate-binding protein [Acidimicrobiia bacterium]MBJ7381779.1 spermidine/putrescine ABC transporter substrate-binding protein [Acidimicrobiia bacterium]MBJ7512724.1 spermidine/putrescine ABC transporter substrate-binding protein [Acidimicrobiia bacterium]
MARQNLSRRQFLTRTGLAVGGVAIAPSLLAACGGGSSDGDKNAVSISNWTGYIGKGDIAAFKKATGIGVTYTEDINDNNEYFAKIQPNLQKGKSISRDGFVLTDWMASRIINQVEWAQPLAQSSLINKKNLRSALSAPGFDPTRKFSLPWASGMAGIAYNIALTGKEIKTIDDFIAVSGPTSVLSEMRDTIGLFMLADGKDITKPTYADAEGAFDRLSKAIDDGEITSFNGNDYVADLGTGNLAAAIAWSGDVAQITRDNPDIRFAIPESGGTLWSDNFMIPVSSDKPDLASEWINFFYDPANAARLTSFIQYISPVEGVAEELIKLGGDAAKLVDDPLVNPTEALLATLSIFGPLGEAEEILFDERFAEIQGAG